MLEYAFGEMELTPHEYYCMTRAEFILKSRGYANKEIKALERTRKIAYTVYANTPFRKGKSMGISTWWPLPNDKKGIDLSQQQMRDNWNALKNKK